MKINEENARTSLWIAPVLKSMGVTALTSNLSGGGDSGSIDDVVFYRDEKILDDVREKLEAMKIEGSGINGDSFLFRLEEMIEEDACALGNWCDNDGGSVYLSYDVTDAGLEETESYINYFEPEEDEDDDFDYEDEDMYP